ncbi:MAG: Ig-like domain-containing protein [Candidatus Parcubacteria bacterium]|nr:Ig-like domain-containing protein [Candidatus Parcubacteria bacterium]
MKKIIFLFFISLILIVLPAKAFQANAIVNLEAPYATFYKGTFDNLVMDFSLIVIKPDTLKALGLRNLGTAGYLHHLSYMTLWADSGPVGFQGIGVDRKIGNLNYSTAYLNWYIENLSEKITDSERFFVSVETFSGLSTSATINMQIPILTDNNANSSFDVGDLGIFMDSGNNGPTDANITNSNSQVISTYSVDALGPKLVITNLTDGSMINNSHFMIQGMARDQGNTYFKELYLYIDNQPVNIIDNFDTTNYTWSFDWQNITDGDHTISLQGRDGNGNNTQNATITVKASQQVSSLTNSSVSSDKTTIKNDGLDKATVTVIIKDQNNQPIANRQITVETSSDMIISNPNNISDANGKIVFEVRSVALGLKTLTIKVDGQVLQTLTLNVNTGILPMAGLNFGDLIKASTPAIYYYGADAKRYVFPNLKTFSTWYNDFSTVKTITDEQLGQIPIGGNVTYRPGVKMVKITTDPKVYAIASSGTLRWISTEQIAIQLYGANWNSLVEDVSDAFFINYKTGSQINSLSDFSPLDVKNAASSINVDKGLM